MQGFVSPGFRHAYWVCFQFSNLLFAALDVFLRILRSSPVYENHYTNSWILFPSGTHKLVLNEFLSTLWCFLGKQIVYPFCFVARWLGTDLFSSLRGICVVSHLLIITIKSPRSRTDRRATRCGHRISVIKLGLWSFLLAVVLKDYDNPLKKLN